jgi:hypothetical protein
VGKSAKKQIGNDTKQLTNKLKCVYIPIFFI